MDSGMKIASLHWIWGGTWSPNTFSDFNTIKYLIAAHISSFLVSWTPIPFEVARVNKYYSIFYFVESIFR
jgi:hypothetical protein